MAHCLESRSARCSVRSGMHNTTDERVPGCVEPGVELHTFLAGARPAAAIGRGAMRSRRTGREPLRPIAVARAAECRHRMTVVDTAEAIADMGAQAVANSAQRVPLSLSCRARQCGIGSGRRRIVISTTCAIMWRVPGVERVQECPCRVRGLLGPVVFVTLLRNRRRTARAPW